MYTLIKKLNLRELLACQGPVVLASLIIAEMFYKFHSFLLETGAFLVTWFVLDAVVSTLIGPFLRSAEEGK